MEQRNALHSAVSVSWHFACGIFRERNAKSFAPKLILRFSQRMIFADSTDSKLCALITRHATWHRLSDGDVAQLGKGQGFAPPHCIPSRMPQASAETVPVSAPSARYAVVVLSAWTVRP